MTTPTPQPSLASTEPVAVTEAIRVVVMAAVAAGWLTLPSTVIDGDHHHRRSGDLRRHVRMDPRPRDPDLHHAARGKLMDDDDRLFTEAEPVIAVEVGRLSVATIGCTAAAYAVGGTTVEIGTAACVAAVSIWLSLWARARVTPISHAQQP